MSFIPLKLKLNSTVFSTFIAILLSISMPTASFALTPIAHTDVIPYQRIEYGTSFNFGVVAFSKAGIDRVDFAISGQGYSGGIKTSSAMTLNTRVASVSPGAVRSGVWEYFVTISASEFTSNGMITVTPTVHGGDADTKTLPSVMLYVEGASNESPIETWVDPWVNDGAGTLNDNTDPYPTIAAAVTAIEAANGDCDYATIYLAEGSYNDSNEFGSGSSVSTTNEWLTVTKESGASTENVVFYSDTAVWGSGRIKFDSVTFSVRGTNSRDIALAKDGVWLNKCRIIGPGVEVAASFPTRYEDYITSSYYHNTAIINDTQQKISRGNKVEDTYDDFGRYVSDTTAGILVVNNEVNGVIGSYSGSHSDIFQADSEVHNIIYFCNIFINLQYQSVIVDSDGDSSDIAIVNNLFEFSVPGFSNLRGWFYDHFDHLLLWHNTHSGRLGSAAGNYDVFMAKRADCVGTMRRTNVSHIGNVWDQMSLNTGAMNDLGVGYLNAGNGDGNEAKYNHYMTGSTYGENYSRGTNVIDFDTPGSATFGYPRPASSLVDAMSSNLTGVPCDAYGNPRDSRPDVGALERISSQSSQSLQPVTNLGIVRP